MKLKMFSMWLYENLYGMVCCFGRNTNLYNEIGCSMAIDGSFECVMLAFNKNSFLLFNVLSDLTVIDYPKMTQRFVILVNLLSIRFSCKAFVLCGLNTSNITTSFTSFFKNALGLERELGDMFGIFFTGHPDLRRLLTDYGYEGFPLRKDYPLGGYLEVRYDDEKMSLLYENVEFAQEFRVFTFLSPGEGK